MLLYTLRDPCHGNKSPSKEPLFLSTMAAGVSQELMPASNRLLLRLPAHANNSGRPGLAPGSH